MGTNWEHYGGGGYILADRFEDAVRVLRPAVERKLAEAATPWTGQTTGRRGYYADGRPDPWTELKLAALAYAPDDYSFAALAALVRSYEWRAARWQHGMQLTFDCGRFFQVADLWRTLSGCLHTQSVAQVSSEHHTKKDPHVRRLRLTRTSLVRIEEWTRRGWAPWSEAIEQAAADAYEAAHPLSPLDMSKVVVHTVTAGPNGTLVDEQGQPVDLQIRIGGGARDTEPVERNEFGAAYDKPGTVRADGLPPYLSPTDYEAMIADEYARRGLTPPAR